MENNKLEKIRHSLAHIMANAVQKKFPKMKFGIGPTIENGFYYDFDDIDIKETDLPKIQKQMKKILKNSIKFEKEEISTDEAKKLFKNQPYKIELIEDLEKEGDKKVMIYKSGEFVDLCAGPHVKSTKEIPADAFKLTKVAGAYWRGDEKNKMLTRIYGVAFDTKEELENYEEMVKEAEKRDHRKLAKELDIFMISDKVGKGLPLWLPNGAFIYKKLKEYMYKKEIEKKYKHVETPILTKENLYKTSGHLDHYREDMYNPMDIEGENYYLRPMNCPHHHQIFNYKPKSYRELPYRMAEFGDVFRFERSGVLTGIIRARGFCQNDAHIYCSKSQLKNELKEVLEMFKDIYGEFNIKDYWFRLSLPDEENKEKYGYLEDKEMWEDSAQAIREVLDETKMKYVEETGEAAFYGPKIDIQVKNVLGKEDTIATVQVDFYSAKKFDIQFTNKKGEKENVVIVHRAIMGSFERFLAFLLEQTAGNLPFWLSPVQVKILPVAETHNKYAEDICNKLKEKGFRAELDDSKDGFGKKVRNAKKEKVPYFIVIGDKDIEANKLTLESRDKEKSEQITLDELKTKFEKENK